MLCQKSKQGKSCVYDSLNKNEWTLEALGTVSTYSLCDKTKERFDFTNDLN